MAILEAIAREILLALLRHGTGWLKAQFVEKARNAKPTPEEVAAFFESGLDSRKAANLLEGLVNNLLKSLELRFMESGLNENELTPIKIYLEVVMGRLEITPELAQRYRYDASAVSRHVESLTRPDELALFSESQRLLVQEVLRDLGGPLLRLCFDMPDSVTEVLRRADELQQTVAEMQIDVLRTREIVETNNPDRNLADFEQSYRTSLVAKLNVMELLGLDEVRRSLRKYPLEASFVHLRLDADKQQMSFEEALRRHQKFLLKGTAGSGKTTLLRWLAIMIGRAMLDEHPNLNRKLPILITLRKFNRTELPQSCTDLLGKQAFMPPVGRERLLR